MKNTLILVLILSALLGCKRDDNVQVEKNGEFSFSSVFTTTEKTERDNFIKATMGVFEGIEGIETKLNEESTLVSQINKDTKKNEQIKQYALSFKMKGLLNKITKEVSKKTGYLQKINDNVYIIYPEGDKVASLTTSGTARIETISNGVVATAEDKVPSINSPYVIFLNDNKDKFEQYVDLKTKTLKYDKNGKLLQTASNSSWLFIGLGLGLIIGLGGFLYKRSRR
jgi:LPXTG-motif cell wall-anchored protein